MMGLIFSGILCVGLQLYHDKLCSHLLACNFITKEGCIVLYSKVCISNSCIY
uniref:Uncharacterized protein n=1 Tax=Setaria viridis TaxID=4556 RepID=A0A4U6TTE2_SETVI|nr:hypothetical protein SEVIR_7G103533v2 [Setaria viridis]